MKTTLNPVKLAALITGTSANETITGTAAADTIDGLGGDDSIQGMGGDDSLIGGFGSDDLEGRDGADILYGKQGNDLIEGGLDADKLTGGAGDDQFAFTIFADGSHGVDTIRDFTPGDDTIIFHVDGETPHAMVMISPFDFVVGTAAGDASDRIIYDYNTGKLYYDPDGTGSASQLLFATVDAQTALAYNDVFNI